ncbi:MAG: cation:proton antiporter [Candidatus Woesearchaeota archaeon]
MKFYFDFGNFQLEGVVWLIEYYYVLSVLLVGLAAAAGASLGRRLGFPRAVVLILFGIFLSMLSYGGVRVVSFPRAAAEAVATLSFIVVLFQSAFLVKLREGDSLSGGVLRFSILFLVLSLLVVSSFSVLLFGFDFFAALIFSVLSVQTASEFATRLFRRERSLSSAVLSCESVLVTPFLMLLPLLVLEMRSILGSVVNSGRLAAYLFFVFQQLAIGASCAILFGIIFVKALKKRYSPLLSPAVLLLGLLLSYFVAQGINSSGIVAVVVYALIFSLVYVKGKGHIVEFMSQLETPIRLVVFLLAGLSVWSVSFSISLLLRSLLIFLIVAAVRLLSAELTLKGLNFWEKLFVALSLRKGAATAALVLALSFYPMPGMREMLSVFLIVVILSIISAKLAEHYLEGFTRAHLVRRNVSVEEL